MALRWRNFCTGDLLCAAIHPEEPNDSYIDDALHYQLSVELAVIVPDTNEHDNGLWHWAIDTGLPFVYRTIVVNPAVTSRAHMLETISSSADHI